MIEISHWTLRPGVAECQCCGETVEGGIVWSDEPPGPDSTILQPRDPSRSDGSWVLQLEVLAEHQLGCEGIPRDVAREVSALTRSLESFDCCARSGSFMCNLIEGHDGPHEARNGDYVAHQW